MVVTAATPEGNTAATWGDEPAPKGPTLCDPGFWITVSTILEKRRTFQWFAERRAGAGGGGTRVWLDKGHPGTPGVTQLPEAVSASRPWLCPMFLQVSLLGTLGAGHRGSVVSYDGMSVCSRLKIKSVIQKTTSKF